MGHERDMSQADGGQEAPAYPAYPAPGLAPPAARPPLTKRMRPVHWIALDCVTAAVFSLLAAATAGTRTMGGTGVPVVLLFLVLIFLPVALRRRAPLTAFGALVILGILLSGLPTAISGLIFLCAAFVLYTVTVEGRRRTGAVALGLILVVLVLLAGAGPNGGPGQNKTGPFIPVGLANVIAWMTGYSVRQRRLYVVTLQQQAASSAVTEERLRIARELHDVVAHSMSVVAVQAGYGQYVIDENPDGAREALGAIQATSRDALEEMRRMLGVLRQDAVATAQQENTARQENEARQGSGAAQDGEMPARAVTVSRAAPLAPAPGLAGLQRLAERTRGAAVRVTVEVSGRARPLPAGVDLSAYRIIQESLTNVVKHAGADARCMVSLSYTDADLVIRVTDDGGLPVKLTTTGMSPTGTGHGIIGMRERVHLCDGTFSAGPLPDGGFQVRAELPLPAAAFQAALAGAPRPVVPEHPAPEHPVTASQAPEHPVTAQGLAAREQDGA